MNHSCSEVSTGSYRLFGFDYLISVPVCHEAFMAKHSIAIFVTKTIGIHLFILIYIIFL